MPGDNSTYGTIGRVLQPVIPSQFTLTNVSGSFLAGQVVTNDLIPAQLACIASEKGAPVIFRGLTAWELYTTGGAPVKPDLRLWFLQKTYTLAAKGSPFLVPADGFEVIGWVDLLSSSWVAAETDAVAADGRAVYKTTEETILFPESGSRSIYVAVTANGTFTLPAGHQLGFRFGFLRT